MGNLLAKPEMTKRTDEGKRSAFIWAVSSMQGWPKYNEDNFNAVERVNDPPFEGSAFFGVFDGHAGAMASKVCSQSLLDEIIKCAQSKPRSSSLANDATQLFANRQQNKKDPAAAVERPRRHSDVVDIIAQGFQKMDTAVIEKLKAEKENSGSTAVCTLLTHETIYIAHCGDSRAILVDRDGLITSTTDHKPDLPDEKRRILEAGGIVVNHRVNGILAVSRAFGDYEYKWKEGAEADKQPVSSVPEVKALPWTGKEELMVLACDGVWDMMTNDEVVQFVRNRIRCTKTLTEVCTQLVETCLFKGSRDNLTALIILFRDKKTGKPMIEFDPKAEKKDREVDTAIERMVDQIMSEPDAKNAIKDVPTLMGILSTKEIDGLPPGGGLASKRPIVQNRFEAIRAQEDAGSGSETASKQSDDDSKFPFFTESDDLSSKSKARQQEKGDERDRREIDAVQSCPPVVTGRGEKGRRESESVVKPATMAGAKPSTGSSSAKLPADVSSKPASSNGAGKKH